MKDRRWPLEGRVLVVDQTSPFPMHVRRQLREIGCVARAAPSHDVAINWLERDRQIKVMLLDHHTASDSLFDQDLADFVCAARAVRSDVLIVGSGAKEQRFEFAAVGVDRFLPKPWEVPDLIEVVIAIDPAEIQYADTQIRKRGADTSLLQVVVGQRVRVRSGPFEGCEGTIKSSRFRGRVLVQLANGVYIEIGQYAVEEAVAK